MRKLTLFVASLSLMLACKTPDKAVGAVTGNGQLPPSFNQREIFSLSMLSNLPASTYALFYLADLNENKSYRADTLMVGFASPIIDATLANAVDNSVSNAPLKLSNWKRVWGPAVMSSHTSFLLTDKGGAAWVSSASMTIFHNTATPGNYVVGIQATNPCSLQDWMTYDFNVKQQQPWYYGSPTSGNMSMGTYLGLTAIMGLTSNNGVTAVQFLDSIIKNSKIQNSIVITGHSLGGALSPVFALYMQHQLDSIGGGKSNDSVYCLSTAGATPGDTTFANYYNSVMGAHTVRIWNFYDLVPRGWVPSLLTPAMSTNGVGGLYSQSGGSMAYDTVLDCSGKTYIPQPYIAGPTSATVNSVITTVINKADSAAVPYRYICNNGINFQGAATNGNSGIYVSLDTVESFTTKALFAAINLAYGYNFDYNDFLFLSEEAAQHTDAYGMYFQTRGIHEYVKARVQASPISTYHFSCSPVYMPFKLLAEKKTQPAAPSVVIPPNMGTAEFMMAYIHCKGLLD
ncbi:hypothetical protein GCM10023093_25150 [Nemorincola caseinilytica]|uniref:Fungal lipase-type domain-containing protein n=1 Tax=Nemorincola caseinilytica TaxID=2054315 RepID=A0ABP8NJS9_9BACT